MKIGVSACLLGNMCRYDGAHSKDDFIANILKNYFEFVPYCPEKMVFTTPREAIRLVEKDSKIEVVTSNTNKVVTKELEDISKELVEEIQKEQLCGFILKSKSPTCGMERVKVYQDKNAPSEKKGVGIFAKELQNNFPLLPIEEEGRLNDAWLRENFLMQIFAYKALFEFLLSNPNFKDLVQFHTSYKYLIYSKSNQSYKILGNIVANHEKKSIDEVLSQYKYSFLEAISKKGNIKKTYNVLLHIFGYFKKLITKEEKQEILDAIDEFKQEIIPLIAVIKILNIYTKRFNIEYLKTQIFLNPYPKELALRSNVKAYK
ncbi:MAG: YbgA family protein [Halarcobacter sp.]